MFLPSRAQIPPCHDFLALAPSQSHRQVIGLILCLRRLRISRSGNSPIITDNKIVCDRGAAGREVVNEDFKGDIAVVIQSIIVHVFFYIRTDLNMVS